MNANYLGNQTKLTMTMNLNRGMKHGKPCTRYRFDRDR
jgi:hypothetical protein